MALKRQIGCLDLLSQHDKHLILPLAHKYLSRTEDLKAQLGINGSLRNNPSIDELAGP